MAKKKVKKQAAQQKQQFTQFLGVFKNSVEMSATETIKEIARDIVKTVKEAIINQTYNWKPLSEKYAAYKERELLDPRIYIATGEFLDSIKWGVTHNKVWVGLPDKIHQGSGLPLRVLGRIHEFGAKRTVIDKDGGIRRVKFIPPRPVWRPALSSVLKDPKFAKAYKKKVQQAMKKFKQGGTK